MLPVVTVLMPVYNGEKYLREAIESILNQTFTDFEFLIIDDSSTDSTWNILKSYSDPRMRLVRNKENLKQPATMNKGLRLAKGKYIARMDADDISLPKRLERQIAFMDKHLDIGICGTWVRMVGNTRDRILRHPVNSIEVKTGLLFGGCLCHPSVMLRYSLLKKHDLLYSPAFATTEDYELWVRCSYITKIANIPEVLLYYRVHEKQLSFLHIRKQKCLAKYIRKPLIEALKVSVSEQEIALHEKLAWSHYEATKEFLLKAEMWFNKLMIANNQTKLYPEPQFSNFLAKKLFHVYYKTNKLGYYFLYNFYKPQMNGFNKIGFFYRLKFRIRGMRQTLLLLIRNLVFIKYRLTN